MADQSMDHRTFLKQMNPNDRARLSELSDRPGLWRLALHVLLLLSSGVGIAVGVPGWYLLLLPQGVMLAFLFTLQHECTHNTPFQTPWLNEVVGHIAGFLIVQPFLWFRYFHLAHHRYTNDPERDPELLGESKPETWGEYLWHLSTVGYWAGKIRLLINNATGQIDKTYVPKTARARVIWEARILVFTYTAVLIACVAWPVIALIWLLPLAMGFPVLRLYLLAEHGRCPYVADMFRNTRTVFTNAAVRFLSWNMPYHTEHHALPTIPFHNLPAFHRAIREHLKVTSDGYVAFSKGYANSLGR